MFTAEERQQIKQLEDMGCVTKYETNIKEVDGGFIVTLQTSYVLDDEVKGVTRDQVVSSNGWGVTRIIKKWYGDEYATEQGHNPIMPELNTIKAFTPEGMRSAQDQAYVQSQTNPHVNPKGSMNG